MPPFLKLEIGFREATNIIGDPPTRRNQTPAVRGAPSVPRTPSFMVSPSNHPTPPVTPSVARGLNSLPHTIPYLE